ncbi:hypothetical protein [Pseudoalteromonas luteoviolacea]|uniref:hypothetical protein n=1 Tax=Pseudoalteromonas luteoviolacea TaxID=43657 RepID=UPI001B38657A|nr:hypothetical protein [Pseudoalteromonas luteoviolacea]MBQ4837200.1 hypothetical protein [Pseudoalteromonas luteoviolacea]
MLKLLKYSSVAIAVTMAGSTFASNIVVPKLIDQPVSIYDFPGTHFDGNQVRSAEEGGLKTNIPFQIQHLERRNQIVNAMNTSTFSAGATMSQNNTSPTLQERSGCPELGLDSAVYASFSQPNDITCFSTQITESTKIEGLLVNIPQGVDYNLYLFKLEDDNSLTPLDTSVSTTAATEQVVYKADPGAYVMVAQSISGTSADQSIMAWFSHPNFDAQEANDKPGQATTLPSNGNIVGNIDSQNDQDFFVYSAGASQSKLSFNFAASDQFSLEIWNGSGWTKVPNNQRLNIDVTPSTNTVFLVKGDQANLPPTSAQYSFAVSDPLSGASVGSIRTYNNENLTNLLAPSLLEAHQEIGMSGTVIDGSGQPVPFGLVYLNVYNREPIGVLANEAIQADENGKFNQLVALPDCVGANDHTRQNRVTRGTPTRPELTWDINWNSGVYEYKAPNSERGIVVEFAHICKEKITRSCYWDRDFSSGEDKYICNRF